MDAKRAKNASGNIIITPTRATPANADTSLITMVDDLIIITFPNVGNIANTF